MPKIVWGGGQGASVLQTLMHAYSITCPFPVAAFSKSCSWTIRLKPQLAAMVKSYTEAADEATGVIKGYKELASEPYVFEDKHVLWLVKHRRYNLKKLHKAIVYLAQSDTRQR